MGTLREQLTALRLDLRASHRSNDTKRLLENMNEIAGIMNTIKVNDLDLSIFDKLIYISLRRKLHKLILTSCDALKQQISLEAELVKKNKQ